MQKLRERRLTNTPTNIPHVRSNCGLLLNSSEGRDSVAGLKTSLNIPDAALTARGRAGQNSRVSAVYVLNQRGNALMPTTPRKARVLLKYKKARVVNRTPFTIQLLYATGEAVQTITLGVDSGYANIGLSVVSDKQELYSAEVLLRTDMVKLNSERRQYRRARRNRKTWYRQPRFLNRRRDEDWFAPSIQHKLTSYIKIIEKAKKILPITKIIAEVAAFDIQKIKNPEISGKEYQQGEQFGFLNTREYVIHRDNHVCQHCKGKSKDKILQVHHIRGKGEGATDRPEELITVCKTCHSNHHKGINLIPTKPIKTFKSTTFMTMVRWNLVNQLKELGNDMSHTYGYITKSKRIEQKLTKSHFNDAFVIAGGNGQKRLSDIWSIKQVRKCNRKLFKGSRSHIRNNAPRLVRGFQRFDKVRFRGQECFIFGRRSSGYFDLRKLDGTKIDASAKAGSLQLLETRKTFLTERRGNFSHDFNRGFPCRNLL